MKFSTKPPNLASLSKAGAQHRKDLRAAALIATDLASRDGQKAVQQRIRSVGLGRLGGAVGQTSAKRQGDKTGDPYGVIYARGGDESQAGGTLESYSRGSTIRAQQAQWLAIPTRAVPRFLSISGRRFRTTPELYRASGLVTSIGKLVFKPIGTGKALLVIKKASVNIRTGRARAPLSRKSKASVAGKDIVAFVLIKVTRRAQRFDQRDVMLQFARLMPRYIATALAQIENR